VSLTPLSISASAARRISLAAQGFGRRTDDPALAGRRLSKLIKQLAVVQIDSVNVVSRTHYLPAFSRLGPYPRQSLESLAWGPKPSLFEYWAHEASLVPLENQPLLRWRMEAARSGDGMWKGVAKFLNERGPFIDRVLAEFESRGALTASDLDMGQKGTGGWWGWSEAKRAVEVLFWTGLLTASTRRGNFERVYDLPHRVLPSAIHEAPTPSSADAHFALVDLAARALGIATETDLRDYFRMRPADTRQAIHDLVEAGNLLPVQVASWDRPAWLHSSARTPRKIEHCALLSPFDNLIWFRDRAERLFNVRVKLEIYTPAPQRLHGYYVLPFLQNEAITARVDLKADRKTGTLRVLASHSEPWADGDTPGLLRDELNTMADWLGLDGGPVVEARGDLASALM
jgi:uncharacterized protein YcaQ